MATKPRRRRAPNPDSATWTPEDRKAINQARFNTRSRSYHADIRAITNGDAVTTTKTNETSK